MGAYLDQIVRTRSDEDLAVDLAGTESARKAASMFEIAHGGDGRDWLDQPEAEKLENVVEDALVDQRALVPRLR